MKVEWIEPFVSAVFTVLETLVGDKPQRDKLSLRDTTFTTQQISIIAGVTGEIEGSAIYGMTFDTAQGIAGAMMGGEKLEALDDMAMSALSELGNMITGNAATVLSQKAYDVDITPPSLIKGKEVTLSTKVPALVVPVDTKYGRVEINVALESDEAKQKAA